MIAVREPARFCQNQDLGDYRIFRILTARASATGGRSPIFGLAGIFGCGEKRNPRETES